MSTADYVIRVLASPLEVTATQWNSLLAGQAHASPFMRHEYLAALHESGSAAPATGWTPRFVTLWLPTEPQILVAACPLYLKDHSYGEYVFDWAWANAYAQHGLDYYPKGVVAIPFTPVPGTRLMARDAAARQALTNAVIHWCRDEKLSSLHLLFGSDEDLSLCHGAGMMLRHTVQFHWQNVAPTLVAARTTLPPEGANFPRGGPSENSAPKLAASGTAPPVEAACFRDFDDFLASLAQDKRKKIRQERRKVAEAGVTFRWSIGHDIPPRDWDFFYRCYERTYLEHGNAPYLNRDFFRRMADTMPENWLMFVAERGAGRERRPIATSLIAIQADSGRNTAPFDVENQPAELPQRGQRVAFGRYWGALERVDCLHFEACYYQPLQWCIEHGYQRFEGGAQGEHKMARALLPVKTSSAHWLAHPAFSDAVERFLEREGQGIENHLADLSQRTPFRQER